MFNFNFNKINKIYISHIEQETIAADSLKVDLEALGYDVVTTPRGKSDKHLKRVCPELVENADAVVVLQSPSASRNRQVWADIAQARLHGIPVIPMVVHEFDGPIPVHHHISAVENFEDAVRDLHKALERKHQFIHNQVDYVQKPTNAARKMMVAVAITVLTAISALLP